MDGAKLSASVCDGLVLAALHGDLDCTDAGDIAAALGGLVTGGGCLIMDMSALDFIDCAALRALLHLRLLATEAGGDVVLAGLHGFAARILDLTGMAGAFRICRSVQDARATVARGSGLPAARAASHTGLAVGADVDAC